MRIDYMKQANENKQIRELDVKRSVERTRIRKIEIA